MASEPTDEQLGRVLARRFALLEAVAAEARDAMTVAEACGVYLGPLAAALAALDAAAGQAGKSGGEGAEPDRAPKCEIASDAAAPEEERDG